MTEWWNHTAFAKQIELATLRIGAMSRFGEMVGLFSGGICITARLHVDALRTRMRHHQSAVHAGMLGMSCALATTE